MIDVEDNLPFTLVQASQGKRHEGNFLLNSESKGTVSCEELAFSFFSDNEIFVTHRVSFFAY